MSASFGEFLSSSFDSNMRAHLSAAGARHHHTAIRPHPTRQLHSHEDMAARDLLTQLSWVASTAAGGGPARVIMLTGGGAAHQPSDHSGVAERRTGPSRHSSGRGNNTLVFPPQQQQQWGGDATPVAAGGPPAEADDEYEALLALDEQRVSKGINVAVQRRILKEVEFNANGGGPALPATGGRHSRRGGDAAAAASGGTTACAVCQEDFRHRERVVGLPPCGHLFHFACVSPWLERDRTCPTCRAEVYHRAVP